MVRVRIGRVLSVTQDDDNCQLLQVSVDHEEAPAVCFTTLVGKARVGDVVTLNTTAVELGLGTGGFHFVMAIRDQEHDTSGAGHIMKVRYTPSQVRVLAVEEEASSTHAALTTPCDLQGMPVAVATLHSLVAPFAVAFKQLLPNARLGYIMTDGAALPAAISKLLRKLREQCLIDTVITCGHAFGGDMEAVTPYSALHAAYVSGCRACIVAMGPGVVGTGTPLGTTALEQAPLLDGAGALGAFTLAIPRLSFADPRPRQRGISHHTLTALGRLAQRPTTITLPILSPEEKLLVFQQLQAAHLVPRHRLVWEPVGDVAAMLDQAQVAVTSMGRTPRQDPAFFAAAAAAGRIAAGLCGA